MERIQYISGKSLLVLAGRPMTNMTGRCSETVSEGRKSNHEPQDFLAL